MNISLGKKDIIWSYVNTIVSLGTNFILLPFIVYYLTEDMLGLWYVFSSVGAIAILFDFGFSVTFSRNITYCWNGADNLKKENVTFSKNNKVNFHLMKQIIKTCKIIYGIISIIALFFLLSIGTVYINYISKDVTGIKHILAWWIYSSAIFLNLYYGYYSSFLRGVGAVDRANKNSVYAKIIQIFFTIIMLMMGMGIIGVSVAYLSYGIVFRFLGKRYFYKYKGIGNELKKNMEPISKEQIKKIFTIVWHNAWRDGLISISNYFSNQITTVICSLFLTLAETGVYSLGVQISSAVAQLACTLYNAYQPELQSAYINSNKNKTKETLSMMILSFIYLFIIGVIGVIFIGIPILRAIKPSAIVSMPVLMGLFTYQFLLKFRNCYTSYFSCTNRLIYVKGFVFSAIICVLLSLIMIGKLRYGIPGLIVAQIISQIVYNLWYWPIKAHRELSLSVVDMIKIGTGESISVIKKIIK